MHLAKHGKNGELSGATLVRGEGDFKGNYSAISFFRGVLLPFSSFTGAGAQQALYRVKVSDGSVPGLFADVPGVASLGVEGPEQCAVNCSVTGNLVSEEMGCKDQGKGF